MEQTGTMQKLKSGFQHSFWVANGMELFERLAYYGQATILSVFLRDHLKFDEVQAGQLSSIFGGLIYFLPIFAGALADKFGFKKAFSFAFFVLAIGYFLIGSTGMAAFSGWYSDTNLFLVLSYNINLYCNRRLFYKTKCTWNGCTNNNTRNKISWLCNLLLACKHWRGYWSTTSIFC